MRRQLVDALKFVDEESITNTTEMEKFITAIIDRNLSIEELQVLFDGIDISHIITICRKQLQNMYIITNTKTKMHEEVKRIIYKIQNIACFKKTNELIDDSNILDFYRLFSLDKKINILWNILNTEKKYGLDTVIKEIKTLDLEEKSKILNTRFIFNDNFFPEDLVDCNNNVFSYIEINIAGRLFIDFMSDNKKIKNIIRVPCNIFPFFRIKELQENNIFYYIDLITQIPEFNINDYVIKGSWANTPDMNVINTNPYIKYAGMNMLHLAILEDNNELYECLTNRNRKFKSANIVNHTLYVNFEHPVANPEYYMSSPANLYKRLKRNWPYQYYDYFKNDSFTSYHLEKWSDSSGDSETKDSRAWHYKQWLKDLVAEINQSQKQNTIFKFLKPFTSSYKAKLIKEEDFRTLTQDISNNNLELETSNIRKLSIAHYHGMQFIQGEYSSKQKFAIAAEIINLCNKKTKTDTDSEKFKLLISKSLMSSLNISSLNLTARNHNENVKNYANKIASKFSNIILKPYKSRSAAECFIDYKILIDVYSRKSNENTILHKEFSHLANRLTSYGISNNISRYSLAFVSSSSKPDNPIKYGFGWNFAEKLIYPDYVPIAQELSLKNAKPRHRLAGFLFVIRMSLTRYLDLVSQGKILDNIEIFQEKDLISDPQDPASPTRMNKQEKIIFSTKLEVDFLDCIELRDIVAAIPLIYPNYSKKFNYQWHRDVLFYNQASYRMYSNIGIEELEDEIISKPEDINLLSGIHNTYTRIALKAAKYANISNTLSLFSENSNRESSRSNIILEDDHDLLNNPFK